MRSLGSIELQSRFAMKLFWEKGRGTIFAKCTYDIVAPASLYQRARVRVVQDFALGLEVAVGGDGLA